MITVGFKSSSDLLMTITEKINNGRNCQSQTLQSNCYKMNGFIFYPIKKTFALLLEKIDHKTVTGHKQRTLYSRGESRKFRNRGP